VEKKRKITIIIVILAILLSLSLGLLAGVIAKKRRVNPAPTAATVTENHITPSSRETKPEVDSSETEAEGTEMSAAPDTTAAGRSEATAAVTTAETAASSENSSSSESSSSSENSSSSEGSSLSESSTASEDSDPGLSLYKRHAEENESFSVGNMFPGDRETRAFRVKVSYHDEVTVHFLTEVREGYEKLAEVMMVEVKLPESGEVLYDGLMRDMPDEVTVKLSTSESSKVTELYYEITACLDTSVGNDYRNLSLVADFRWWVEEEGNLGPAPDTGDTSRVLTWCILSTASLACLILLIYTRKRKEERSV